MFALLSVREEEGQGARHVVARSTGNVHREPIHGSDSVPRKYHSLRTESNSREREGAGKRRQRKEGVKSKVKRGKQTDRVSLEAMIDRTTTRACCSGRGSRATERELVF